MRTGETGERAPSEAPGELELVRGFVNTRDIEAGTDALATPAIAATWLRDEGFPVRVHRAAHEELLTLREALRDLVSTRGAPGAAAAVDQVAQRHPLVVRLSPGAAPLEPSSAGGVDAFVGRILAVVAAARIDGTWERMKTCANDGCRWLYYDHSRNRSRTWCAMDLCGSQAKMRAYRARRRSTTAAARS